MKKQLFFACTAFAGISSAWAFTMEATVYDSDAGLHPAFSCYSPGGEGCQVGAQGVGPAEAQKAVNDCIGITPNVVDSILDPETKKPTLTTAGKKCFIDAKYFNQLFNYTEGVNEVTRFSIPFGVAADGHLLFDSDFYTGEGAAAQGGLYPVEMSTDEGVLLFDSAQVPLAAARKKREAEGPVFFGPSPLALDPVEGEPRIDLICNGPGWNKGFDCTGRFSDGEDEEEFVRTSLAMDPMDYCVLGWSCPMDAPEGWKYYKSGTEEEVAGDGNPRWGGGTRNQHFCLEVHTQFTYKPGIRFSFRASDDLWVFIDNKLAVDLGGTHMTAPGYVDLDYFKGVSEEFKTDEDYDLDIFFCDRRTTMNALRIKTNAFPDDGAGIKTRRAVAKSFSAYAQGNSIAIAVDNRSTAKYTVLNAMGSVIRSGNLQQGRAVVPALTSGSYIVKVGSTARRVIVH